MDTNLNTTSAYNDGVVAAHHPDTRLSLLEGLTDALELHVVVETLAKMCAAKSEHIQENWQDEVTAHKWAVAARLLESTLPVMRRTAYNPVVGLSQRSD